MPNLVVSPLWKALCDHTGVEEVWVTMPVPEGIYVSPAPTGRVEMVGDEKRAVCTVDRMPDVVYVNGVRFIPAGGR